MNKFILIAVLILFILLINQEYTKLKNLPDNHPHKPIIFKLIK